MREHARRAIGGIVRRFLVKSDRLLGAGIARRLIVYECSAPTRID